jgi:hypothetical protein
LSSAKKTAVGSDGSAKVQLGGESKWADASDTQTTDIVMSDVDYPDLSKALAAGLTVLIGVTPNTGRFANAVAVDDAGNIQFLGACADRLTAAFHNFLVANPRGVTEIAELRRLSNASESAIFKKHFHPDKAEPKSWDELAPSARQFADENTPADVKATVSQVRVTLRFPSTWLSNDSVICGRTDVAWSECVAVSTATADLSGDVHADLTFVRGRPLEIWARTPDVSLATPLARLATIASSTLARAETSGIVLTPKSQLGTYADFVAQAVTSGAALAVAVGG